MIFIDIKYRMCIATSIHETCTAIYTLNFCINHYKLHAYLPQMYLSAAPAHSSELLFFSHYSCSDHILLLDNGIWATDSSQQAEAFCSYFIDAAELNF